MQMGVPGAREQVESGVTSALLDMLVEDVLGKVGLPLGRAVSCHLVLVWCGVFRISIASARRRDVQVRQHGSVQQATTSTWTCIPQLAACQVPICIIAFNH
jgi:hypothetical protein